MKIFIFLFFGVVGFRADAIPMKQIAIKQVVVGISDAYIPSGFDTKADPIVVVNGYFPSGCYSMHGVEVSHLESKLHEVRVVADVRQTICTMALIPYQKEVSLGALVPGEHKVRFPSSDGTYFEKNLTIE